MSFSIWKQEPNSFPVPLSWQSCCSAVRVATCCATNILPKTIKKKQDFWWFCCNSSCQAAGEWTRTNVGLVSPVVATATRQSTTTTTTKPQGELCHFLCPFFFSNPTVTLNGIQTPPQSAPQTDCGHCMCMCVNTYAHNILSNVQRCKNSGFYFVSRHCNPVLSFFTIQQCYGFISPGVGTGCSELF